VTGPLRPGKRADLRRLSGQKLYPVIEFESGSIYREESRDLAATIRAGRLDEKRVVARKGWRDVHRARVPVLSHRSIVSSIRMT